jgi:hypothetical protein
MSDPFIEAQRKRKRRTKYWREHVVLAYAVLIGATMLYFLLIVVLDRTPAWLVKVGFLGPSGAWLLSGTISCGFGVLGLSHPRTTTSVIAGAFCSMAGMIALARAFGMF